MNFNEDALNEQKLSDPPQKKKSVKKTVLITVSAVLALCIVAVSLSWVGFLRNNPFAEMGIAFIKTFKDSAKGDLCVTVTEKGKETVKTNSEIAVVNKNGRFGLTSLGEDGNALYLDGEYLFVSASDGSVSIIDYNDRDDLDLKKPKKDIKYVVRFLNKNVFKKELLDPEETEERFMEIAEYYGDREYLEENLGFSVTKENGAKTFSFNFGLTEFISVVCNIVYNSEEIFNEKEAYETVVSLLKIASNLDVDSRITLDVKVKNGYISEIELDCKTFDKETEKQTQNYSVTFSDYKNTELIETVLEEFSKAKEKLGDFKRYERNPDGSRVFTDKDGNKHKIGGDTATVCASENKQGMNYA